MGQFANKQFSGLYFKCVDMYGLSCIFYTDLHYSSLK